MASSYDGGLQGFGMYSYTEGDETAQEIFEKVVRENLGEEINGDGVFKLVSPTVDVAQVELGENRELARDEVFERQILEEMKYRAPIEFTLSIIDKFTVVADAAEEANKFIDITEEIAPDYDNREISLASVEAELKLALALAEEQEAGTKNMQGSTLSSVKSIKGIIDLHDDFIQALEDADEAEDEADRLDGGDEEDQERAGDLRDEAERLREQAKNYYETSKSVMSDAEEKQAQIVTHLKNAGRLHGEAVESDTAIKKKIEDYERKYANSGTGEAYENVREHQGENSPSSELNQTTGDIAEQNWEELIYEDELDTLEDKLLKALGDAEQLAMRLNVYAGEFTSQSELENAGTEIANGTSLQTDAETSLQSIQEALDYIQEDWRKRGGEEEAAQGEADDNAKLTNEQLDQAFAVADAALADQEQYDALNIILQKYGSYNSDIAEHLEAEGSIGKAAEMMGFIDTIMNELSNLLVSARDELYINEYIMTRFTSSEPYVITNHESYLFENKEIEYMIYGHHIAGANYASMISNLFMLRFALRLIDAFTQKSVRTGGHPIIVAILAISYALYWATEDLTALTSDSQRERNQVPLISDDLTKGINFNYTDYLRLFLLLTPDKQSKLDRIKTMLEDKTSSDLTERPTYIQGEAEVTVKLWFLPGVAKLLDTAGMLPGEVNGNELTIKKEAVFSY
ncbi:hypothetical protein [Aureibacillus halotolerans]|uniref:hypothetical protein n=1 Tax=Aureibacillus halotolerans TaxID=1508390 RepID=UPI00105F970D|nr:hypothetical protein [Aureibacillus halotolerans]